MSKPELGARTGTEKISLRIKICGITSVAEGLQAAALGADALGVNFYTGSSRYVDRVTANAISRELPPFVVPVALFVNAPLSEIAASLQTLAGFRTVQWYGENREIDNPYPLRIISAFSVGEQGDLKSILQYLDLCRARAQMPAAVLVDAHVVGQYGGTGQRVPWNLLMDFDPGVPLILAGGLTPENVTEAIRAVQPYGVDVASGVEVSPGRKDPEMMRRFIGNAREAAARYL